MTELEGKGGESGMWRSVRKLFLFKLIATFSVILAISFVIILLYSDGYLNQKALGGMEGESVRALSTMRGFVNAKMSTARRFVASLYNTNAYSVIPSSMADAAGLSYDERVRLNASISDFLQSAMSSDLDIINVAIAGLSKAPVTMVSKGASSASALSRALSSQLVARADTLQPFGPTLFPAYITDDVQFRQYLMPVYSRIKSNNMLGDAGYLMVDFSCASLDLLLKESLSGTPSARFLVLSGDGMVMYDSQRESVQVAYPGFSALSAASQGLRRSGDGYVNCEYDADARLYYLSAYPLSAIDRQVAPERLLIYTLILLLAGVAITGSALFARHYYRRIEVIQGAIGRIVEGDLKVRAPEDGPRDELLMIAHNLNQLVERLEMNIEEAYHSGMESQRNEMLRKDAELKLVNAELYALQTQVNPHFLHNALEAIRMRALSQGNGEVARMAYILSTLFKYNLSRDMIVSVAGEMDMCHLYMEMIQIRHPGRCQFALETEPDIKGLGFIRHALLPVLENSLIHGLDLTRSDNRIDAKLTWEGDVLVARVQDNGRGMAEDQLAQLRESLLDEELPEDRKIGLRNVHLRILRLFGAGYGVSVEAESGRGTAVTIRIPAMDLEEMRRFVQRADR
jgi:two-component system sensor histidine kinase YesM